MKLIPLTLLTTALPCFALAQELTTHGNFRHMMHTGATDGTIALDTLSAPSAWGVGATAGLRGEVLMRDGAVLVSRGDDPQARVTPPDAGEKAVILAFGTVADWQSVEIPHDMAPDRLTHFIEMQAQALGLDPAGGFPIRVQGSFPQLVWHVVTGEAPSHRGQSGLGGGNGGGHANSQSGMNLYDEAGASGEIVGVYTGAALEGIASHPGERLHLHFVSADGARSGHVDKIVIPAGATLLLPSVRQAAAHDPAMHGAAPVLHEGGQSAFAAIQEITAALMADPATDWSKVDIETLRQHLIDMDNVTLRADVDSKVIDGGARFLVTSTDPAVISSIRVMVPAHVATMNGAEGWTMQAEEIESGAIMTVTGPDEARIRGLGFIGLMTVGMHHQTHHLALASGQNPHAH
ncbi:acetolactate decarboxylase [Pseudogemmobacter sp. W21_MBD1_M6]|uniref:acetolactate decarboxylase n=1 Tax=Pseudogemmobacter sp. W21_MBD1_M6 TaxID=3240271 RepID=UPI003F9D93D5